MARRQFDFWLGSWNCSWTGGSARNEVTAELDGMAVVERFSSDELQGISVSVWDEPRALWRQTWVDSNGAYLDFAGGLADGVMELRTMREELLYRMRFTDVERDSLVWHWERESDGGWAELWRID